MRAAGGGGFRPPQGNGQKRIKQIRRAVKVERPDSPAQAAVAECAAANINEIFERLPVDDGSESESR